ncbi:antifreeze protein [Sulfitobacter sp. NFXS29]|uniref:antifreeze protein n=1 Tax=Sulfitobacter sp. NFXS29 TaxID=2818438 RepID=UPI0032DE2DA3
MQDRANKPYHAAVQRLHDDYPIGVHDMTPFTFFALQSQFAALAVETQIVMSLRLLAMAGALPARPGENNRMVAEKGPAMVKAFSAGTQAMMLGKSPDQVMNASLAPLARKVRQNRKRLMK